VTVFAADREIHEIGERGVGREVFILTTEPPEILGGMETFIRAQIHGLEERGYAVRVFIAEIPAVPPSCV